MCIYCNVGETASPALGAHRSAMKEMRRAQKMFMKCAEECENPVQAKRYKQVAYAMARMRRRWNRIEMVRERPEVPMKYLNSKKGKVYKNHE